MNEITACDQHKVELCARAAHEANRAYQLALGNSPMPHWDETQSQFRATYVAMAGKVLEGFSPRQIHEDWVESKVRDGWSYGEKLSFDKKENPLILPYGEVSELQKSEDHLFVNIVRAMAPAVGVGFRLNKES